MNKICTACLQEKNTEDFPLKHFNAKGERIVKSRCKRCHLDEKIRVRTIYRSNHPITVMTEEQRRSKAIAYQKSKVLDNKQWLREYKSVLSCAHCNLLFKDNPWVCEFHHIDPVNKENHIATMMGLSRGAILREIEKCIPLCANCHRTVHYLERTPLLFNA